MSDEPEPAGTAGSATADTSAGTTTSPGPVAPGTPVRRRAFGPVGYTVTFGVLAVVVVLLVGGGVWVVHNMGSAPAMPDGIQFVLPPAGGAMMSQDRVGVQTQQSWTCNLVIDGIRIPESEHVGVKELGECYFQAGPERIIEAFTPGRHLVQATVFPISDPNATQTFNWSFQAQ